VAWAILVATLLIAAVAGAFLTNTGLSLVSSENTPEFVVVWPLPYSNLFEKQVFVAEYATNTDMRSRQYRLYWEVDDGVWSGDMLDDGTSFKSQEIPVTDWDWSKDNTYRLTFYLVHEDGRRVAETSLPVHVGITPTATSETVEIFDEELLASADDAAALDDTATAVRPFVPVIPATQQTNNTTVTPPEQSAPQQDFSVEWVPGSVRSNQKFIFHTPGHRADDVSAFWNVEGGHKNFVFDRDAEGRYVAALNVYGWRWKNLGPYTITLGLIDKQTSEEIGTEAFSFLWTGEIDGESFTITSTSRSYTPATTPTVSEPPIVVQVPQQQPSPPVRADPVPVLTQKAHGLYVAQKPAVERAIQATDDPRTLEALQYLLQQPGSVWLNGDGHDSDNYISGILQAARTQGTMPVFVLYNIPDRDCGSHSSGGAGSSADYRAWIDRLSRVLSGAKAIVIVEPDALAQLNCVAPEIRDERLASIAYAVRTLRSTSPDVKTYIDAGHPFWVNVEEMAQRLTRAGVQDARGFALNVSNFVALENNVRYGNHLSNLLGGKRYVVDTSRNGRGPSPDLQWCNPNGRALGTSPRLLQNEGIALDALLWIKYPGESDGHCNGGPRAGTWWTEYAVNLYYARP
jgi:endoglucanase